MPKPKDVVLYGKTSAAAYLGISKIWLEQLVEHGEIRVWQEVPPTLLPDGSKKHGSGYVFTQQWLDEYKAKPKGKPGWPKGRPRKNVSPSDS